MKRKLLALALVAVIGTTGLIGCSAEQTPATNPGVEDNTPEPSPSPEPSPEPTDQEDNSSDDVVATSGAAGTGIGIVTSVGKSKSAAADAEGLAQIDSTVAVVTVDENGVITKCSIDAAQTKLPIDEAGVINTDVNLLTKIELGADYGMASASSIDREWDQQIQAFSNYVIGKTLDEVKAISLDDTDNADMAELATSVTITVTGYIDAIEKAIKNVVPGEDVGVTTGLGIVNSVSKSKSAEGDTAGLAQVDTTVAAVALDSSGKIVNSSFDVAQIKVPFDASGDVNISNVDTRTKRELKEDYGMGAVSGIGKEWYEQADVFSEHLIGKTESELSSIPVAEGKVDDADLAASVTVTVTGLIETAEKAIQNAR